MVRVNGGFVVLNFMKYRDFDHSAADRMRKLRERKKGIVTANGCNVTANIPNNEPKSTPFARTLHIAEAEAEAEAECSDRAPAKPSRSRRKPSAPPPTDPHVPPAARPPPARDPVFDALAAACGSDPLQLTGPAARKCGIAKAEILKVAPGIAPSEFQKRAAIYRQLYPDVALTPLALSAHWAECIDSNPRIADKSVNKAGHTQLTAAEWKAQYEDPHPFGKPDDPPAPTIQQPTNDTNVPSIPETF